MYIRQKKNKSGTTSVHIVEKRNGMYTFVKTIGSSDNPDDTERLILKAQHEMHRSHKEQPPLFASMLPSDATVKNFIEHISNNDICTVGPEIIFGTLFNRI